jgi:hypothetical protein
MGEDFAIGIRRSELGRIILTWILLRYFEDLGYIGGHLLYIEISTATSAEDHSGFVAMISV